MSRQPRYPSPRIASGPALSAPGPALSLALSLVGLSLTAALPLAVAPGAAADPVWPVAGGEPADATLNDLSAQGYTVQINWVTGYPTVPLSECWVDDIHNPDGPPTRQHPLAIVYVDIGCPSNNLD